MKRQELITWLINERNTALESGKSKKAYRLTVWTKKIEHASLGEIAMYHYQYRQDIVNAPVQQTLF